MRKSMSLLAACLMTAGCANSLATGQDQNVQSSLQYDSVPCSQLLARRGQLTRQYQLPEDAKPVFAEPPVGLGLVLPDMRSRQRRDAERAAGEIDAMNRSLIRRQCIKAPPKAG